MRNTLRCFSLLFQTPLFLTSALFVFGFHCSSIWIVAIETHWLLLVFLASFFLLPPPLVPTPHILWSTEVCVCLSAVCKLPVLTHMPAGFGQWECSLSMVMVGIIETAGVPSIYKCLLSNVKSPPVDVTRPVRCVDRSVSQHGRDRRHVWHGCKFLFIRKCLCGCGGWQARHGNVTSPLGVPSKGAKETGLMCSNWIEIQSFNFQSMDRIKLLIILLVIIMAILIILHFI